MPDRLCWVILARGWGRPRIRAQGSVPVEASGTLWQAALEALQRELPVIPIKRGTVSVVVSNALVRYLVVNSGTSLTKYEERLALACHDFHKIHGVLAEGWDVCISAGEQNYVAAALDRELLVQLRQCFAAARLKVQTVQPYAVAAFNHWAKCFDSKAAQGLFLPEPYGYCYAAMTDGRWEGLHSGRWEGDPSEACQHVIQREAHRTGIDTPSVWLAPSYEVAISEELVSLKCMKSLPLDKNLGEVHEVGSLMALLGAM